MDTTATRPLPGRLTTRGILGQLGVDTAYLLVGFPISVISFTLIVTGFSLGAGLFVTLLGIPVLVGTLLMARGFGYLERERLAPVLRARPAHPRYRRSAPGAGPWRWLFTRLADPQMWLDLLHGIVNFPVATTTFSVVVTWWSVAISGLFYGLYDWALPSNPDHHDLTRWLGFSDSTQTRIILYTAVGAFFALTLVPVVRGCALAQAHIARGMLNAVAELRERISGLEQEKAVAEAGQADARAQTVAAVSAEAVALRKLERDIHDGPQQRLVRLAMDLGRAQHQLDNDPDAARATVTEAIAQTRETLDELRALSRGIAPPVLVDRGLVAALAALAGRSTVPVDLDTPELGRLNPAIESAAYFVVAEALTNVAKHSQATEVRITLQRSAAGIMVQVSDDGVGGAQAAKGHGLAGLADRVRAAGGRLRIDSSPETGTTLTAELPL